jgi:hypothetical protein
VASAKREARSAKRVRAHTFSRADARFVLLSRAGSAPILPCGLAAWTYFNDTFVLTRPASGLTLDVSTDGIAFKTDKTKRFATKSPAAHFNDIPALRGGGALDPAAATLADDERFLAWMRTPALSDFRKLWGRIDDVTIEAGETVQVAVINNWNSYGFGGAKRIVLSTSTWLGGANNFLGIAYLSVGCICMALALLFSALVAVKGRRLADPKYYSWNKPQAARE